MKAACYSEALVLLTRLDGVVTQRNTKIFTTVKPKIIPTGTDQKILDSTYWTSTCKPQSLAYWKIN
jgi:hypothetical protein